MKSHGLYRYQDSPFGFFNDDGSGIAAILEMVRIMSSKKFPATIIFMAVTGEEHGLYGARHMATLATVANFSLAPCEPANCGIVVSGLTNKTTFMIQSVSASGHESIAVFPGRAGRSVFRKSIAGCFLYCARSIFITPCSVP